MLLTLSLLLAAVLQTNANPKPGELGAFYFDALSQSQVWVTLSPESVEPGPSPVLLNVTVSFPGRRLEEPPKAAEIRATAISTAFPLRIRQPILRFETGDGRQYDLTAPGRVWQFVASCQECPLDTLTTRLAFEELREIARSSEVTMNALGFALRLKPSDVSALQTLIDAVSDGVTIK
jgi:hypothetical protein